MKNTAAGYGRVAQAFHWLSALLILVMAPMGLLMVRMEPGPGQDSLYRAHATLGTAVLGLTLLRLIWVIFVDRWPPAPAGLTGPNRLGYLAVHVLLYVVILSLAATGLGMLVLSGIALPPTSLSPALLQDVPPRLGHSVLSKIFIALFVAHMGGVFFYQFTKGNALARMGVPVPGKGPAAQPAVGQ